MSKNKLEEINKLIEDKKISEAEFEISKLGSEFFKNVDYLYLRSKIFFGNKLYYVAIDTLLIATEFEDNDKIYQFLSKIYSILGNKGLRGRSVTRLVNTSCSAGLASRLKNPPGIFPPA